MENPHRGEVSLVIDGQPMSLRLTLGALAALEARLEAGSLIELAERFEGGRISAAELTALLAAGLAGGGNTLDEHRLNAAEIEGGAVAAMRAGLALLARAFAPVGDGCPAIPVHAQGAGRLKSF